MSGAAEYFFELRIQIIVTKKFSWSYENFKFVSQKSWEETASPPPQHFPPDFARFVVACLHFLLGQSIFLIFDASFDIRLLLQISVPVQR